MVMLQVLNVNHYPVFGGPHNQVVRLDAPLLRRGIRTVAVLPAIAGNAAAAYEAAGVPTVRLPLSRIRATPDPRVNLRAFVSLTREVACLRDLIISHEIDVVQVTGLLNVHGALAARLERRALVWQLVDTRPPPIVRRVISPLVGRFADVVMSTGTTVAHQHPGSVRDPSRLFPFIPPVDVEAFRPSAERRGAARRELGVPEDALLIGAVGNINPQKGFEFLIEAAAELVARFPTCYFRLLGARHDTHEAYGVKIESMARERQLMTEDRFRIIDPGRRVEELLPAFDIYCLTSVERSEGISTAVLEAMSCAIPVIATDVGGMREAVHHGRTGLIVPARDADRIRDALIRLLEEPALRRELGDGGRRDALNRFAVDRCADVHAAAYRAAVCHRSRAPTSPDGG